jgi:hypothetical protein
MTPGPILYDVLLNRWAVFIVSMLSARRSFELASRSCWVAEAATHGIGEHFGNAVRRYLPAHADDDHACGCVPSTSPGRLFAIVASIIPCRLKGPYPTADLLDCRLDGRDSRSSVTHRPPIAAFPPQHRLHRCSGHAIVKRRSWLNLASRKAVDHRVALNMASARRAQNTK